MRYAIIDSGGKQYRAVEGRTIEVDRLPVEKGEKFGFERVLFMGDGEDFLIGTPDLDGIEVEVTVVDHIKGPKIDRFKYRPKKRIRVRGGHRQQFTLLMVDFIGKSGEERKVEKAEPAPVVVEEVEEAPKAEKKAKAAKPARAGCLHCFQHWSHPLTQFQIGVANNGSGHLCTAIRATGAFRRQPFDEFDFTHRTHLLRSVRAVPRFDLDKHRRTHIVPTVKILCQVWQQVLLVGHGFWPKFPQVVMRVADGELGLQGRFGR